MPCSVWCTNLITVSTLRQIIKANCGGDSGAPQGGSRCLCHHVKLQRPGKHIQLVTSKKIWYSWKSVGFIRHWESNRVRKREAGYMWNNSMLFLAFMQYIMYILCAVYNNHTVHSMREISKWPTTTFSSVCEHIAYNYLTMHWSWIDLPFPVQSLTRK